MPKQAEYDVSEPGMASEVKLGRVPGVRTCATNQVARWLRALEVGGLLQVGPV